MARDFDGSNDEINCGSDASIDDLAQLTTLCWLNTDLATSFRQIWDKGAGHLVVLDAPNGDIILRTGHATDGEWSGAGTIAAGAATHVATVHDSSSDANNPTIYIDGVSVTVTESVAPVGARDSDAANALNIGETLAGSNDFDGAIGWFVWVNGLLTAADVNRHRWWGCAPGGPSTMKIWHPFWTDSLVNRATATADGTAVGTTMNTTKLPKVERMHGSMMGVGR